MTKSLTVIFGAGASFDLIPPQSQQSIKDTRFRPPLTKDIFTSTDERWEGEYSSFRGVEQLLGQLRSISDPDKSAKSLEQFLKKLKTATEDYKRKQFRHFPPYLQYYFGKISWEYCHNPTNYNSLLNETLKNDIGKVAYVTLNYDLLFDRALEKHNGINYRIEDTNLKKYIPDNQQWMYIKLHGSVDWGRKINHHFIHNPGLNLPSLLDNIDQIGDNLEKSLEDQIVIDLTYKSPDRQPIYPAISAPVDGESKFNCPQEHLSALKDHLNGCSCFLVIGYSGIDTDLIDLLNNKEGGFQKVLLVSGSEEGANKARNNLMSYPGLTDKLQMSLEVYPHGFSNFMNSGRVASII